MYYLVVNRLVTMLREKVDINEKNMRLINIAAEYITTIVINLFLAAGIGHTFQIENQLILFSVFYSVLRVSNGGNYLKLNLKKSIARWGCAIVLIRVVEELGMNTEVKWMILFLLALSLIITFILAPYGAESFNVAEDIKGLLQKRSTFTISAMFVIILAGCFIFSVGTVFSATMGVFLQSLTMLPAPAIKNQVVELNPIV